MIEGKHVSAWGKYLPAIRIVLKRAVENEQQMQLDRIAFEAHGDKKPGFAFNLILEGGRVKNDISKVLIAKDLFRVLNQNEAARTFLSDKNITIQMSSSFLVTIKSDTSGKPKEELKEEVKEEVAVVAETVETEAG